MENIRWIALGALIVFVAYTLYVWRKAPFFVSLKALWALHWGRQVTVDLYVGVFLFSFLIYMVEGALLPFALWTLAICIFGNPVSLLYFVINFDRIVAQLS